MFLEFSIQHHSIYTYTIPERSVQNENDLSGDAPYYSKLHITGNLACKSISKVNAVYKEKYTVEYLKLSNPPKHNLLSEKLVNK